MKTPDPFAKTLRQESERAATTTKTAATGLHRLPTLQHPKPRQMTSLVRQFGEINPELLHLFRDLVRGQAKWPLLLYGPPGTGKTRAALCLCDVAETAAYQTADRVASEILARSINWGWIARAHLAVLDELAMRTDRRDLDYVAVKEFCDRREDKPIIYISNCQPGDLVTVYDERVYSRVACGTWFELTGEDRRMH